MLNPAPHFSYCAGVLLFLLAGCSGDPSTPTPSETPETSPIPTTTPTTDADQDGSPAALDCDDLDPSSAPGLLETCDGHDNDCNGTIDDDVQSTFYLDQDGDGFGDDQQHVRACTAPPGYVYEPGDCDDRHPSRYPGAPIACDGHDNNCDGQLETLRTWYFDRDGDGFGGSEQVEECDTPFQGTQVSGDCQDSDPTRYPAAPDPSGDGIDQDCGGSEAAEPCVGYDGCFDTLAEALSSAASGVRIAVGPGIYFENALTFGGKNLTLYAPAGPQATVIDGQGAALPLVIFDQKESKSAILDGFTLQNSAGGALSVTDASPTLRGLVIQLNRSSLSGAGGRFVRSAALLERVHVYHNTSDAEYEGGGGFYLEQSPLTLSRVSFEGNLAPLGNGGGLYMLNAAPKLSDCRFAENEARQHGGGAYIEGSGGTWSRIELNANHASWGAGLALSGASPSVLQSVFLDNRADEGGGGMYLRQSSSAPLVQNTIFAWNSGGQLQVASQSDLPTPTFENVLLHSFNGNDHNFPTFPGTGTLTGDPGFVRVTRDGKANDSLYGKPDALLLNRGKTGTLDDDGSPADLGIYGGPGAPRLWLADADADGLPDGWEKENGLSLDADEHLTDQELDGVTVEEEWQWATDPRHPDTDLDQVLDGLETLPGQAPLDFYQRPGEMYPARADVPGDFDTLEQALAAVRSSAYIRLGEGTFAGGQTLLQADLILEGRGQSSTFLSGEAQRRTLKVQDATLRISELTLQDGVSSSGAGLWSKDAELTLFQVHFTHHQALGADALGGCALIRGGTLQANAVAFEQCEASGANARGGGVWLDQLTGLLDRVRISDAHARDEAGNATQAGGLGLDGVSLEARQLELEACSAQGQGGGLYAQRSNVLLTQSQLREHQLEGSTVQGAGFYVRDSTLSLAHVWIEGNVARSDTSATGGGGYLKEVDATFEQVVWLENEAGSGGGFFAVNAALELEGGVCAGNHAGYGGGIFVTGKTNTLHFRNVVLAENSAEGFYDAGPTLAVLSAEGSVLSAGVEGSRSNGSALEGMMLDLAPQFLVPTGGDVPPDVHLSLDSAVLNLGVGTDLDGTGADPGAYGDETGCAWDLDGDGLPAWCWAGNFADIPAPLDPENFDCDDLDPFVTGC
ncbi:MAG: MopE-related protein [Myxococcota bacterium]